MCSKTPSIPRAARILLSCGAILASASGCQSTVKIAWKAPNAIQVAERTPLAVADLATLKREGGVSNRLPSDQIIGVHRFTILGLPVAQMNVDSTTPLKESLDRAFRDALESTGYELVAAEAAPAGVPVLRGEVTKCWLWSYSYFWPFMVEGGRNKVTLYLDDASGRNLWTHTFSRAAPAFAFGGAYGFDSAVRRSLTKILKDIQRECGGEGFRKHLVSP